MSVEDRRQRHLAVIGRILLGAFFIIGAIGLAILITTIGATIK